MVFSENMVWIRGGGGRGCPVAPAQKPGFSQCYRFPHFHHKNTEILQAILSKCVTCSDIEHDFAQNNFAAA